MNLNEIKAAVSAGKRVYWSTKAYEVCHDITTGRWLIVCAFNGYTNGLTHRDGITMDDKEADFFTECSECNDAGHCCPSLVASEYAPPTTK